MAIQVPRAFWPFTITAGVNDKVDVRRTSDSVLFVGTIAAGTYFAPQHLARAIRDALQAAWDNDWGIEVYGCGMTDFNPSFESSAGGWAQYNNSAGLEPFTTWARKVAASSDPPAHGLAFLQTEWAVNNTTTKGLFTNTTNVADDGRKAGCGWRLAEDFRVKFKARATGTNVGKTTQLAWNQFPTVTTTILNPALSTAWQQYDFRVRWNTNLPGAVSGVPGEMFISIITNSQSTGRLEFDDIDVRSEATQYGHFAIGGQAAFQLLFDTGANAALSPREFLGFGAVDTVSATTVVAPNQHQNGWYADDPPKDDTGDLPYFSRGGRTQTTALDGKHQSLHFGTRTKRSVALDFLPAQKMFVADEAAVNARNEAIERLVRDGWARFRWWQDRAVEGTSGDYVIEHERFQEVPRSRYSPGLARYTLLLPMLSFV